MHGNSSVAPVPSGSDDFVVPGRATVLYQGDDVVITSAYFESNGLQFPIPELTDVERVEAGSLLQSRLYELWAWFRGDRVRLFHCADSKEFGQVCRALTRARERAGLT